MAATDFGKVPLLNCGSLPHAGSFAKIAPFSKLLRKCRALKRRHFAPDLAGVKQCPRALPGLVDIDVPVKRARLHPATTTVRARGEALPRRSENNQDSSCHQWR
jgi:hypothetical protein